MRLMMMPLSKLVTPTQPSKHGCPSTSNFYWQINKIHLTVCFNMLC
jgi:hypothetical protein